MDWELSKNLKKLLQNITSILRFVCVCYLGPRSQLKETLSQKSIFSFHEKALLSAKLIDH